MSDVASGLVFILFHIGLVVLELVNIFSRKYKMEPSKKKLHLLSLISTILFTMTTERVDGNSYYYGFPAESISYHGGWMFDGNFFSLIFNFFFFYLLFTLFRKLWRALTVTK